MEKNSVTSEELFFVGCLLASDAWMALMIKCSCLPLGHDDGMYPEYIFIHNSLVFTLTNFRLSAPFDHHDSGDE
jgi:hypothetical protein